MGGQPGGPKRPHQAPGGSRRPHWGFFRVEGRRPSAVGGEGHSYSYTVAPERVKIDSHLGQCKGTSMCCRYVTDIFETIDLRTDEKGVYPTAAAVLRDCFDVLHTAAR